MANLATNVRTLRFGLLLLLTSTGMAMPKTVKAAEHCRTPKRGRHRKSQFFASVLECGGAPPLFDFSEVRFSAQPYVHARLLMIESRWLKFLVAFQRHFGFEIFAVATDARDSGELFAGPENH